MVRDDSAPATKVDILMIKSDIRRLEGRVDQHDSQFELMQSFLGGILKEMNERFEKVDERFEKMNEYMHEQFAEQKRYFDVVAENLLFDFKHALNDRTVQHDTQLKDHDRRIGRIEKHVNLTA